jgi:hypothetical protein
MFWNGLEGLCFRGLGGSHLQHNFSAHVASYPLLESFSGSRKRKQCSDDDAKNTFVDQTTKLDQLCAIRLNDEEFSSHAERSRLVGRHWAHNAGATLAGPPSASSVR